jgi:hypothetical protein
MQDPTSFVQYLIWSMEGRGVMRMPDIYHAVQRYCARHGRALPDQWEAMVRQTLQAHCASRPRYEGGEDFFVYHERGLWSCKVASPTIEDLLLLID